MNFLRHITAVSFLPLMILSQVKAQVQDHFEHLGIKDGLSHSIVFSVVQDKSGFIWLATQDGGLNKYDGYGFTVFEHDPNNSNSLASNNVSKVICDRNGNIWIGTWGGGLDKYDQENEKFIHYKNDPGNSNSLSHNNAQTLFEDSKGNIWTGTAGGGLNKLDPATGKFTVYKNIPGDSTSLSNDRVWSIAEDRWGNIWTGTSDGLNKLEHKSRKFKRYAATGKAGDLSHPKVRAIHVDGYNRIWIGTTAGVDLLEESTGKFTNYKPHPGDVDIAETNEVNVIYSDRKGGLWIGTHAGGLCYFNSLKKTFRSYRNNPNDSYSISYNDIRDICEDRSGILWIATRGGGMNKFDLKPSKFMHYAADPEGQSRMLNSRVRTICVAGENEVWLGTDGGGLSKFNLPEGTFANFVNQPGNENSISSNRVRAVCVKNGKLWIGTDGSGLNCMEEKTGKITRFENNPSDENTIIDNDILCLASGRKNDIWIGTDNGLDLYDVSTGKFIHYKNKGEDSTSLSNNRVWCLLYDSQGILWAGTDDGLNAFDHKTGKFTQYKAEAGKNFVLSNNDVYCLAEDKNHDIWIGTGRGLNRFERSTGKFYYYTDKHGLPGNSVYSVLESANGELWISTINGLARFNTETKTFRNYFVHDGLQSNEFLPGSGTVLPGGFMFFGGINGFNVFHPDRVKENEYIPQIAFTGFSVFNKPVLPGKDSPLSKSITYTKSITLSYDQDVISIQYAALSYNVPEENQYAYQLVGFDDDWVMAGNKREAHYTSLAPGKYVFKVKASNNDGIWNEEGISLEIIITPPFWQTTWFYILCGVVLTGILFLLVKMRERKLTAANRILEEKVARRTEKINQQNQILNEQREELEHKHRDIMDSIKYAKRIQEAILPPKHIVDANIKDHFVLYKPKDIVSGDFYWTEEYNGKVLVAAVDCTGHGVPGAFVSIVGNNGLNRAVNEFNLTQPAAILDKLNSLVVDSLRQGETEMKDGMDLALCCIDRKNRKVEFSGANNSLYVVSEKLQADEKDVVIELEDNRKLYELRSDKQPIGGMGYKKIPFTNHKIDMIAGDMIYLFTDGFADQFGGPKGKKFKYSNLFKLLGSINRLNMDEQKMQLNNAFEEWKGSLEQIDDVCIIGIRL